MLYDVISKIYMELYDVSKLPSSLIFRLKNINAKKIKYDSFKEYFNLNDKYAVFKFILDDNNLEEMVRYSTIHRDSWGRRK